MLKLFGRDKTEILPATPSTPGVTEDSLTKILSAAFVLMHQLAASLPTPQAAKVEETLASIEKVLNNPALMSFLLRLFGVKLGLSAVGSGNTLQLTADSEEALRVEFEGGDAQQLNLGNVNWQQLIGIVQMLIQMAGMFGLGGKVPATPAPVPTPTPSPTGPTSEPPRWPG